MRAYNAINIIIIVPEQFQETNGKPSLSVVLMYHELSNPTNGFFLVHPAASNRVTCKTAVYSHPHVRACAWLGHVVCSNSSLGESYVATLYILTG